MKKWNFSIIKCINWWKALSKKKKVLLIPLAAVIVISGSLYLIRGRKMPQAENSVQETTAQTGDISNTIVGTGNLEVDDSYSVTIPSGIVIEEVKVEGGDCVSKGDVLAVLNQVSVLSAMETVQGEIEALDKKINSSKNSTEIETVTAKVSGRVKKIYVEQDGDVADSMVKNGALILLSIDGEMAVDLDDVSNVSEGDTVVVVLSDNTEEEGIVASVSEDTCTVTFTDANAEIDEKVKVKAEDGSSLGRGEAYIHQKLEITATGGTVSKIHVEENDKVSSGASLLTLKTNGQSVEYQQLIIEREELAKSLQKLVLMAETGTVTADMDGTIGEVNVSAEKETSGSTGTGNDSLVQTGARSYSHTQTGYALMNLSSVSSEREIKTGESQTENTNKEQDTSGKGLEESSKMKIQLQIEDSGTGNRNTLVLIPPKTGEIPQKEIIATDGSYTGKVSWNPGDSIFAEETAYQADITLYASEDYIFDSNSILKIQTGLLSGITVSEDGKTLTFRLTFSSTKKAEQAESGGAKGEKTTVNGENTAGGNQNTGENTAANGKLSGNQTTGAAVYTSSGSQGGSSTGSSTEDTSYSKEVTAFTLASDENMILSVSVDELDINSVSNSQKAEVALDAIDGETFTGTVTKVGNSASSASGGVAKYSVEITIPKNGQMKVGMNASATIVIENKENILKIPIHALQEKGNKVFVYTQKDNDGNLLGEKEVTTGLSDGDMVEITEGLSEGDVIYYQKNGSTSGQSFDGKSGRKDGFGDFPNGSVPDGGNFPGGSSSGRPDGGRGGKP